MADLASAEPFINPALQRFRGKGRQRYRLAAGQRLNAGEPLRLGAQFDMQRGKPCPFALGTVQIALVIGKGSDMDRGKRAQLLQHMKRTDLISTVCRPGNTVRQKQYLAHHPRPLEIQGPARLASGSGIFCQIETKALYLPLAGLTSRGATPSAVRVE